MKKLQHFATILLLIGGINWGLIGLFGFDLIEYVFGHVWLDRLSYLLIGVAALLKIVKWQTQKG